MVEMMVYLLILVLATRSSFGPIPSHLRHPRDTGLRGRAAVTNVWHTTTLYITQTNLHIGHQDTPENIPDPSNNIELCFCWIKSLFVFKTNNYLRTQSDLLHLYPRGQLEQAFPITYTPVPVNYLETELLVLFEIKFISPSFPALA